MQGGSCTVQSLPIWYDISQALPVVRPYNTFAGATQRKLILLGAMFSLMIL